MLLLPEDVELTVLTVAVVPVIIGNILINAAKDKFMTYL